MRARRGCGFGQGVGRQGGGEGDLAFEHALFEQAPAYVFGEGDDGGGAFHQALLQDHLHGVAVARVEVGVVDDDGVGDAEAAEGGVHGEVERARHRAQGDGGFEDADPGGRGRGRRTGC